MNRKSFLTTALLSFAALLMPRKAQALTEEPAPKIAPPTPPRLLCGADFGHEDSTSVLVTETFTKGGAWEMNRRRDDGLWEQVAVGHWTEANSPMPCPKCQGRGVLGTFPAITCGRCTGSGAVPLPLTEADLRADVERRKKRISEDFSQLLAAEEGECLFGVAPTIALTREELEATYPSRPNSSPS